MREIEEHGERPPGRLRVSTNVESDSTLVHLDAELVAVFPNHLWITATAACIDWGAWRAAKAKALTAPAEVSDG